MALSWTPSSPRPSSRPTALPATADASLRNYHWFKSHFERTITSYIVEGKEDDMISRVRPVIEALILKEQARRYPSWKVLEGALRVLTDGTIVICCFSLY